MNNLNAQAVLCTINNENVEARLTHRATFTNEKVSQEDISKYIVNQQRFIDLANKSSVPTMILNTDRLCWDEYAETIISLTGIKT